MSHSRSVIPPLFFRATCAFFLLLACLPVSLSACTFFTDPPVFMMASQFYKPNQSLDKLSCLQYSGAQKTGGHFVAMPCGQTSWINTGESLPPGDFFSEIFRRQVEVSRDCDAPQSGKHVIRQPTSGACMTAGEPGAPITAERCASVGSDVLWARQRWTLLEDDTSKLYAKKRNMVLKNASLVSETGCLYVRKPDNVVITLPDCTFRSDARMNFEFLPSYGLKIKKFEIYHQPRVNEMVKAGITLGWDGPTDVSIYPKPTLLVFSASKRQGLSDISGMKLNLIEQMIAEGDGTADFAKLAASHGAVLQVNSKGIIIEGPNPHYRDIATWAEKTPLHLLACIVPDKFNSNFTGYCAPIISTSVE